MKALFSVITLCLLPVTAHAGDPCPVPIKIHDLGVPSWLDRDALLAELQTQKPWIGIRHRDIETGLELTYIHPNSAAAAAGLQQGDVVTAVDDVLATEITAREALLDAKQPGNVITFARLNQPSVTLTVSNTDPVPIGMDIAFRREDCRTSQLAGPGDGDREMIMSMLFDENRRFRCYDAHIALQSLGELYEITDVYFVRGSRRILITMPYWGTTCINSSQLDGDNYTNPQLLEVLYSVVGDFVNYNIENP